jgi:hypothetical protein
MFLFARFDGKLKSAPKSPVGLFTIEIGVTVQSFGSLLAHLADPAVFESDDCDVLFETGS